jgi:hypothetical protein
MHAIIDRCTETAKLFKRHPYLPLQAQKTGKDPDSRVSDAPSASGTSFADPHHRD